ncbi:MAG: hypothetical protein WDW38_004793 [Sanguina aurantia]
MDQLTGDVSQTAMEARPVRWRGPWKRWEPTRLASADEREDHFLPVLQERMRMRDTLAMGALFVDGSSSLGSSKRGSASFMDSKDGSVTHTRRFSLASGNDGADSHATGRGRVAALQHSEQRPPSPPTQPRSHTSPQ